MTEHQQTLGRVLAGARLTEAQAYDLFDAVMTGGLDPALLAGLVAAIAVRGESVDELVGAARALRGRVARVTPPGPDAIDTCGTGGDGKPTFNVSSAVAIVAAAAGATVAKHGNRSNARPSGSVEGLSALGIDVDADPPAIERCLRECRVAFLNAQRLHPAMKHAAPVRRALGVRTIFNLLGPLANPAGVRRQLLGVSRAEHVGLLAAALCRLGVDRALVVCGFEGLCDISLAEPTHAAIVQDGAVRTTQLTPEDFGLRRAPLERLFVDGPQASATVIQNLLGGEVGAPRDAVLLNAAAALWVAGVAVDWRDGAARAAAAVDSGAAADVLDRWRRISRSQSAS